MTGMSAEQAWTDLSFNPRNVPRQVPTRLQRFMPLEPITLKQENRLNDLIYANGLSEKSMALLFGEGYEAIYRLSSWAASWAIGEIEEFEDRAYADSEISAEARLEQAMKAHIAERYRTANPELRTVTVHD